MFLWFFAYFIVSIMNLMDVPCLSNSKLAPLTQLLAMSGRQKCGFKNPQQAHLESTPENAVCNIKVNLDRDIAVSRYLPAFLES